MSDLPLFYRSIEPLNSEVHRLHRLRADGPLYGFAAKSYLLPAVVDEFATAARSLAIMFAPSGKRFAPVFLCGLRPGSNLFINREGLWTGSYVPAYLRRYPFMLGEREGADPVVCIDTAFEGFGPGDDGARLFDDDGATAPQLSAMIQLVTDYALAAKRTEALCQFLSEHDLFKSVTVDVNQGADRQSASIHGLSIVDEERLGALSDEVFSDLRKRGLLGPIYAHLFSVGSTQALAAKLAEVSAEVSAEDAPVETAA
jgi:hypothetical protein